MKSILYADMVAPPCLRCAVFHYHASHTNLMMDFDCPPERLMMVRFADKRCIISREETGFPKFLRLPE